MQLKPDMGSNTLVFVFLNTFLVMLYLNISLSHAFDINRVFVLKYLIPRLIAKGYLTLTLHGSDKSKENLIIHS